MLTSITPLGERGRGMRWGVTTGWFAAGATAGGAVIGVLFGALGATLAPLHHAKWTLLATALAAALGWAFERSLFGLRLPSPKRQVDDQWLYRYRGWVYGGGFGFQLGLGFVTVVNTSLVYLTAILCFVTGSPALGACLGGIFGAARGIPLLLVRHVQSWEDLVRVDQSQEVLERTSEIAAAIILAGVVAIGLVSATVF